MAGRRLKRTLKNKAALALLHLCLLVFSFVAAAAEEAAPKTETKTEIDKVDSSAAKRESGTPTPKPAPQDTLGGKGLKERKLSDVFEQFVPSETISADNAVPFPVDI